MVFVFPNHHQVWWGPALLGMAEHPPAHGKQGIHPLLCFVRGFCVPYGTAFISDREFSPFTLPILALMLQMGE